MSMSGPPSRWSFASSAAAVAVAGAALGVGFLLGRWHASADARAASAQSARARKKSRFHVRQEDHPRAPRGESLGTPTVQLTRASGTTKSPLTEKGISKLVIAGMKSESKI